MSRYDREIEVAENLARQAGALVMAVRADTTAEDRTGLEVEFKDGNEPVTIADRQSSDLIVHGLQQAFPDDIVISEERPDDLRRLDAERVWYIDPIDGTRDFIRGFDGFAVMIGLAVRHRPAVGVVFWPTQNQLFVGDGHEAWMIEPENQRRRLRVSDIRDTGELRLVASRSRRSAKIDIVKNALGISQEINIGSVGLKLSIIALGNHDLYVNPYSNCKTWDTCAPEAILVSAGGLMSDVHGMPLAYNRLDMRCQNGLVASNGWIHDEIIERLGSVFPRSESSSALSLESSGSK